MSSTKIKPVFPVPRRANAFSIEALMRKDTDDVHSHSSGDDSDQGRDSPEPDHTPRDLTLEEGPGQSLGTRLPPLHPGLPDHVKQLLLTDHTNNSLVAHDAVAIRNNAWAFSNQQLQLGGFPHLGMPPQVAHGLSHALPGVHPGLLASHDPMSMYPWLMSRQAHGFMGLPYAGHPETGFFFHPYRKAKRIRTAFSPTQLLKLEHAFEKNHYVVGQERKELALKLSLTETQVKVWFQNRRTKHKRVRSEDDESEPGNISIDDDDTATSSRQCHSDGHFSVTM